ncbi:hypothetical protein HNP84_007200 [Thermocatellispora tengchongensis]|uniref:Uncharacterized protein n=1 Tax=Thermocatellispora tengchongensis TaxID=1073253 RepID=A0A840PCV4_9ACTN|nr:hypothetical protein [Thermocatellispora tengchongensis]MBB5137448.1 hypothetical protein [Thermocatellispora tengchongensis]
MLNEVLPDACPQQAVAAACVLEDGHAPEAVAGPAGTAPAFAFGSVTKVLTATMVAGRTPRRLHAALRVLRREAQVE